MEARLHAWKDVWNDPDTPILKSNGQGVEICHKLENPCDNGVYVFRSNKIRSMLKAKEN